jgi:hypothetical protein
VEGAVGELDDRAGVVDGDRAAGRRRAVPLVPPRTSLYAKVERSIWIFALLV